MQENHKSSQLFSLPGREENFWQIPVAVCNVFPFRLCKLRKAVAASVVARIPLSISFSTTFQLSWGFCSSSNPSLILEKAGLSEMEKGVFFRNFCGNGLEMEFERQADMKWKMDQWLSSWRAILTINIASHLHTKWIRSKLNYSIDWIRLRALTLTA